MRWKGSALMAPEASYVFTSTRSPSRATVILPAGGDGVTPPSTVARVAVETHSLTERSNLTRNSFSPRVDASASRCPECGAT